MPRLSTSKLAIAIRIGCLFCLPLAAVPVLAQDADTAEPAQSSDAKELDAVIVTANKREQRASDIAGGISVVTGAQLTDAGAQSYADYLGKLPGVVFNAGPAANSTAVIRGVGTSAGLDQGQGPTGYYLNEIPLTEPGYAVVIPDIDTFDVNRVEVLRGPQGTLYGASSLGGAINYVANQADASEFDAAFETSVSETRHASSPGHTAKAMLNLPLVADQLALRAVATKRHEPGYVDNIGIGRKGSNDVGVVDGRLSLVWTPNESTRLSWLSLRQNTDTDDASYQMTRYGELTRSTALPASFDLRFTLHSLRLDQDLGFATLTGIAAFNRKEHELHVDYTPYYGGFLGTQDPQLFRQLGHSDNHSYELRLASPNGGKFEWLLGASYQKTTKRFNEDLGAEGAYQVLLPQVGADQLRGDKYYWAYGRIWGSEKAVFGEAYVNFTDRWKLTLGGRWFDTQVANDGFQFGVFFPEGGVTPPGDTSETGFVPKVALGFKATPDTLLYAQASKGYRFGNPNSIFPLEGFDTPAGWNSDSLWNYELGVKTSLLDRRLQIEATVFRIDWDDLQVRLVRPDSFTYGTNAGTARIDGFEFAGAWRPTPSLELSANYTWLDARLTEDVDTAVPPLRSGQTLPGASKQQVSGSVAHYWEGEHRPSLTLSGRYLSEAPANLQQSDQRINGFSQFDARYAMWFDNLEASVYVNNIADKRGVTFSYGDDALFGVQEFVIRPRTVGLRLHWHL
ncbi:MAG: TonB-dependent receptor [Pseudoxanthomonas sp.]